MCTTIETVNSVGFWRPIARRWFLICQGRQSRHCGLLINWQGIFQQPLQVAPPVVFLFNMHFFNDQGGRKNWKQSATTLQLFSWGIRSTCSLKLLSKWFIWLQRRLGVWGISCRSEGDQLAGELGVPMFHTSVKTDKNVASVFHSLATAHQSRNRDQVEVEQVSWIHFHKTLQMQYFSIPVRSSGIFFVSLQISNMWI